MATDHFSGSVSVITNAFASSSIPGPSMTPENNAVIALPSPSVPGVTQPTAVYSYDEYTTFTIVAPTTTRRISTESPLEKILSVQVPISPPGHFATSPSPTMSQNRSNSETFDTIATALGSIPLSITDTVKQELSRQSLDVTSAANRISRNDEMGGTTTFLPSAYYPGSASSGEIPASKTLSPVQSSPDTETPKSNNEPIIVVTRTAQESVSHVESQHARTSDIRSNGLDSLTMDSANLSTPAASKTDDLRDDPELLNSMPTSSMTEESSKQGITERPITMSAPRYTVSQPAADKNSSRTLSQEVDKTANGSVSQEGTASGSNKSDSSGERSSTMMIGGSNAGEIPFSTRDESVATTKTKISSIADTVSDDSARQSIEGTSVTNQIGQTGEMGITTGSSSAYYPSPDSSARRTLDSSALSPEQPSRGSGPPTSDDEPITSTTEIARSESVSLLASQQTTTSKLESNPVVAPTGNESVPTSVASMPSEISDLEQKYLSRFSTAAGSWSRGISAQLVTMGTSLENVSELFGLENPSLSQEDGAKNGQTPKDTATSGASISAPTGKESSVTALSHSRTPFEHVVVTAIKHLAEENREGISLQLTTDSRSSHLSRGGQLTGGHSTGNPTHLQNDPTVPTQPTQPSQPAKYEDFRGTVLVISSSHNSIANLSPSSLRMPAMASIPSSSDSASATELITPHNKLTTATMVQSVDSGGLPAAPSSEHSHTRELQSATSTRVQSHESFSDAGTRTDRPTRGGSDVVYQASQSHSVNKSSVFISVGVVSGALCVFLVVFGWARRWCKNKGTITIAHAETQKLTPRDPNRSYFSLYSEDGS